MTYDQLISKAFNIERALIAQGNTQAYMDNRPSSSYNDKPHTWDKNKNVTNDGVVNAKVVISGPKQTITQPSYTQQNILQSNIPQQPYQQNILQPNMQQQQNNQQTVNNTSAQKGPPPRNNYPHKHKYTLCVCK